MADQVPGYVLKDGAFADGDATVFPGLAGVWRVGEPIATETLLAGGQFADADALAAYIKANDVPLKRAKAAAPESAADNLAVVAGSTADFPADPPKTTDRSVSPMPGLSREEFDERVAWENERADADPDFKKSVVLHRMAETKAGTEAFPAPEPSGGEAA